MLLGPSGQNIYPEEIEDKLNNMPFVCESIIIQQEDHKLAALIYPDFDEAYSHGMSNADIEKQWKKTVQHSTPNFRLIHRLHELRFTLKNSRRPLRRV